MNKIIFTCLLAAVFAFAQEPPLSIPPAQEPPAAEPQPLPPAPAPVAPAPAAPVQALAPKVEKTIFDVLRGHVYNPYGIAGAATSVTDLIASPSDIHGEKFAYFSPDNLGFAAFDLGESSMLIGLHNSGYLGALVLGYATQSFGVALDYSVGKIWQSNEVGNITFSNRTTYLGDNIGLYFSLPSGFYANLGWRTYESYFVEIEGYSNSDGNGEYSVDDSHLSAQAGWLGNSGALNYDVYLNVWRDGVSATNSIVSLDGSDGDKAVDLFSHLGLSLNFKLGYAISPNKMTRVIIGSNNSVGVYIYDDIKDFAKRTTLIFAQIRPNILGEIALSENLLTFAGAAQSLFLTDEQADMMRNNDVSELQIWQNPTQAFFIGMRYQKANWALETRVSDNPFAAFAGNQILTQLGGFIYF